MAVVDVVLPCLDEARALPVVLANLPADARAIVVDNGSTDGSADVAAQLGATVIACAVRGYGAACHAGLEAADADLVAFCDCDGSIDLADVTRCVEALRNGADLVVARRRPVGRDAWSLSSRIANRELARRIRRRTGLRIADVGPLRAARRQPLLDLGLTDRRFGYPAETVVRAADAGWTVTPLDIDYRARIGHSKVTGTVRGTVRAVRDMSAAIKDGARA